MADENDGKVDCFHCRHFAVTWDAKFPRLCKLFGFKTSQLPSVAVFNSSGNPCEGFERKQTGSARKTDTI